jgi:hypothetical protein
MAKYCFDEMYSVNMKTNLHTLYETVQNYFQQVITKFAKCDSEKK